MTKILIDRSVVEEALEALETCDAAHISDGGRQWYDDKAVEEAITALRSALAQQAEPVEPVVDGYPLWSGIPKVEPGPAPVGVVTSMVKGGVTWRRWPADMPDGTLLFSEVQP